MLCTTAASFPPTDIVGLFPYNEDLFPISEEATEWAEEIRAQPPIHVREGIVRASRWIYAVMEAWRSKLRDYHVPGEASAMTGAKLAALVFKHMRAVLRLRRRLLKNNVEYSTRSDGGGCAADDGGDGMHTVPAYEKEN